ncbi:MAG: VapB-type antitoxin [Candidatus Korarchaeota archaeon]|nr:VapB-type antitoxin [Candidatus Korarchaeota archaeon]
MSRVIGVRVSRRILAIADKMVRLGLARSRNEALNILLERGAKEVLPEIRRAMKVEEKVKEYEREGGIDLGPVDTAELVRRERSRWTT